MDLCWNGGLHDHILFPNLHGKCRVGVKVGFACLFLFPSPASALFCSVLLCSVLFCSDLFCSDLFRSFLFCSALFCSLCLLPLLFVCVLSQSPTLSIYGHVHFTLAQWPDMCGRTDGRTDIHIHTIISCFACPRKFTYLVSNASISSCWFHTCS